MENKNTIIALVLMLVVWIGFSFLNPPPPPTSSVAPPAREQSPAAQEQSSVKSPAALPAVVVPSMAMDMPASVDLRELVVETDTLLARFTNSGARLKSLQLKKYTETADTDSPMVTLTDVGPERLATLRTSGTDGFELSPDALYSVSTSDDRLRLTGSESHRVGFTTVSSTGLTVEKVFTFHGDRYDIDLQVRVANSGTTALRGNMVLSLVQPWDETMEGSSLEFVGPSTLVGEEVKNEKVADLAKEPKSYGRDVVWSAFENKYFISAAIPLRNSVEKVRIEKTDETILNTLETPYQSLASGESLSFDYLLYFGPRDLEILKEVNHQLAEAIDFGFFGIIAKPLRHVLNFFYSFVGNYGLAIILVTVIIKLLFWPLTQKSYTSMKAMQKLQPEMGKIREKYKNDKERLNREMMELYKKNRVNPLGGCLPMLVQIPVFFALYKVLLGDIALRHAPFAFWLTDLSAKDPYYVTPIIMGATMFIQQKMTPSSMDPTQAKMFMLMPVVFTFMFLNFPSGLVIYWLINNLLTIGQQYYINRKP
jgi:YidC/Oxa1 family membrane protein insertase